MDKNALHTFLSYFEGHKKLFWPSIEKNLRRNETLFEELGGQLVDWASIYLGGDYAKILADGYASFVTNVSKSQVEYEKQGEYKNKTYEDVYNNVYNNPEHMELYHWGVYVITFAWEHHLKIYKFYKDNFIQKFNNEKNCLLDLGSGSGVWGLLFLRVLPSWNLQGVDISKTSVEFANNMSSLNELNAHATYSIDNALSYSSSKKYDACISCFLLEHLDTPNKLLLNMANNLKDRGYAFITGALTAAEVDHITEFKCESELVVLAEKAGFRVLATYSASPESYPSNYNFLPRSMALVLQKKRNDIW